MKRAYLLMHIAIILWGFTGILGKAIGLGFEHIVWYRMLFSSMSLFLILIINKQLRLLPLKEFLKISMVGLIVVVHWLLFYAAIKVSNVSITLSCFSSITLFTSIIEPIVNKRKIDKFEILFALIVMIGIYVIFAFQKIYVAGIALALLSSFFGAIFTILNKRLLENHEPALITFYELFMGFVLLSLFLPFYLNYARIDFELPTSIDFVYLLILSIFCTTISFTISLMALKKLNAFIMNLSINLEPIYSIVLAIIIFHEDKFLNSGFYLGTAIIISAVFIHGLHQWYMYRKNKNTIAESVRIID